MQIQALDTTAVTKTPTAVPTPAPAPEPVTPPAGAAPAPEATESSYPSYRFEIGIRVEISLAASRREDDDHDSDGKTESVRGRRHGQEVEHGDRDGDPAKRAVKTLRKALHRATKPLLRGRNGLDHEGRHDLKRAEHDLKHDLEDALKSFRAGETDAAGFVGALADAVDRFETSVQQVMGIDPAPTEDPVAPLDPVALPQTPLTPQAPVLQSAPIDPSVVDTATRPEERRSAPGVGEGRRFPDSVFGSDAPGRAQGVLFELIDEIQSVLQSILDSLEAPEGEAPAPASPADPPAFEAPVLRVDIGVALDLRV